MVNKNKILWQVGEYMKITKTAEEVSAYKLQKKIANRGCNVCPCCHEKMNLGEAIKKGFGLKRGISSFMISKPIKTGLFSSKYKTVTKYSCHRCGAEWESEPY